jgi:hypothetical protein
MISTQLRIGDPGMIFEFCVGITGSGIDMAYIYPISLPNGSSSGSLKN